MKLLQLLLVILVSEGVFTAPVREGEGPVEEEQGCSAPGSGEDTTQQELDAILEQGLLNSTDNQDKIKSLSRYVLILVTKLTAPTRKNMMAVSTVLVVTLTLSYGLALTPLPF